MKKRYQRMGIGCAVLVVAVIIFGVIWYFINDHGVGSITFVKESGVVIEYGEEFDTEELIQSVDGELKETAAIDTKKIGEQTLLFVVEKDGKEKEVSYVVEIRDTKAPIITLRDEEVSLYVNDDFHADDYIVSIQDPVDGDLVKGTSGEKGTYWWEGDVDLSQAGDQVLTIRALDQAGNEASATLTVHVTVRSSGSSSQPPSNSDSGGYDNSIDPLNCEPYYVNGILLVNKRHPLPPSFGALDPAAAEALGRLQAAARLEGYDIPTISGFCSYDYQVNLYNSYVAQDGQAAADTYSARPGFSEHQTGMVFDVGSIDNNYGNTVEGTWLREHCHEYGFIIRYPQGKENITGYMYEPWHIRYVGVNAATQIYQRDITLEEYLGVR